MNQKKTSQALDIAQEKLVDEIKKEIMLKKEQMEPVKAVLLAREQEKERIKNEAIPNKKALKELNEKSEAQLKSILSEEQWKSWEKWREEQKAKRKDTPTNDEQD
jgi:parvulin-like peptidyl-prolyl isomerase